MTDILEGNDLQNCTKIKFLHDFCNHCGCIIADCYICYKLQLKVQKKTFSRKKQYYYSLCIVWSLRLPSNVANLGMYQKIIPSLYNTLIH